MIPYNNPNGGIEGYEIGEDFIRIFFKGGGTYVYSNKSCGSSVVDTMIALADSDDKLTTFINQHKPRYESKS